MCKTIKQRVKFKAPPSNGYDLLADSRKHSAVTGKKAAISRKVGGTFSAGGNDVSGINVDLVPGRRIVQAWRHRRFAEGIFSMAAVTLTPTPDGGTELVLTHREGRLETDTTVIRGINSIQLMNDGTRWWVVSVFWEAERPDNLLPPRYLRNDQ